MPIPTLSSRLPPRLPSRLPSRLAPELASKVACEPTCTPTFQRLVEQVDATVDTSTRAPTEPSTDSPSHLKGLPLLGPTAKLVAGPTSRPLDGLTARPLSRAVTRTLSSLARWAPLVAGAAVALSGCGKPPLDPEIFPPSGNLRGTVLYSGPPPCTQNGHVVGAVVLLVFNENLLPPPEGFGTTAQQIQLVAGDALFQSILPQLTLVENSSEVICPPVGSANVTVSAPWVVGPLDVGNWQVRSFYDYDGDFRPVLKIHNLPTAGDIGGGAIDNLAEALAGAPPKYTTLTIGVPGEDGKLRMPDNGALVDNISVSLGLDLHTNRPIFNFSNVIDERPSTFGTPPMTIEPAPTKVTDALHVVLPQDERFATSPTASPGQADKQFIRIELGASLREDERAVGAKSPFSLQVEPPFTKLLTFAHTDADGNVVGIPEKSPSPGLTVADMFPQAIFGKLQGKDASGNDLDPTRQVAQSVPAVVLQGLVLREGKLTSTLASNPASRQPTLVDSITVALRPSVICLDPFDVDATVYVVTPELNALDGTTVVDPEDLVPKLRKTLGRPNIEVIDGCLPKGIFQTNLVYSTGQAWTIPNEAGFCVAEEQTSADTKSCTISGFPPRATIASQRTLLSIGDEREKGYCEAKHKGDSKYLHGVPKACLSAEEQND